MFPMLKRYESGCSLIREKYKIRKITSPWGDTKIKYQATTH